VGQWIRAMACLVIPTPTRGTNPAPAQQAAQVGVGRIHAVATAVIGNWVGELDRERADTVLAGRDPFDEVTMLDDDTEPATAAEAGATATGAPGRSVLARHVRTDCPNLEVAGKDIREYLWSTDGRARMSDACTHLDLVNDVIPSSAGCEDCLRTGGEWVHLRLCMSCGHVGCCDSSPNRHATAHYVSSQHPLIQSYEPGEDWWYCYVHETSFVVAGVPSPAHS